MAHIYGSAHLLKMSEAEPKRIGGLVVNWDNFCRALRQPSSTHVVSLEERAGDVVLRDWDTVEGFRLLESPAALLQVARVCKKYQKPQALANGEQGVSVVLQSPDGVLKHEIDRRNTRISYDAYKDGTRVIASRSDSRLVLARRSRSGDQALEGVVDFVGVGSQGAHHMGRVKSCSERREQEYRVGVTPEQIAAIVDRPTDYLLYYKSCKELGVTPIDPPSEACQAALEAERERLKKEILRAEADAQAVPARLAGLRSAAKAL